MNILKQVEKIAFDSGFSEYGYVKIDDLKYYQEVRTICEGNSCRNYAASWACPLFLILGGSSLVISIFDLIPLPFDAAWIAILLCGLPIIMEAIIGLVTAFDIKADVLVSLALIASVFIGENFAAGEVAFIMQLGALLEDLTVSKARAGIEKLVHLTPQTARILSADGEKIISAEQVQIGDRIRVLPGETVPVDGKIVSGQTSINQAVMTGESLPVDKTIGDNVSSGTFNQFGAFEMEATKVGEDSSKSSTPISNGGLVLTPPG